VNAALREKIAKMLSKTTAFGKLSVEPKALASASP
jgi:hypothetical protein